MRFLCSSIFFLLAISFIHCRKNQDSSYNKASVIENVDASDSSWKCIFPCFPVPFIDHTVWIKYLKDQLSIDSSFKGDLPAGTYTILIKFSIDRSGEIGDVSSENDAGYGLADWVVSKFKKFKIRWQTSDWEENTGKIYMRQPVVFMIEEDESDNQHNLHNH